MKNKVLLVLCTMVTSFIGMFSVGANQASASGTTTFTTEDGKWDNTAYPGWNGYRDTNVQVDIWNLTKISDFDRYNPFAVRPTQLSVRLCNASSKKCTGYKTFETIKSGYGRVHFYNMPYGVYNVDIRDHIYWNKVRGKNLVLEWY